MKITRLHIENLRIIQNMELEAGEGLNFIHGPNGSGKTSILESIYLLGQGKSFRHSSVSPMIRKNEKFSRVTAKLQGGAGEQITHLGVQRSSNELLVRYEGKEIKKRSALFRLLPLQLITPQSHELIEKGPEMRRRYLDFGLFHVEQSYHKTLLGYQRALKQRNAALRNHDIRLARSFNDQLVSSSDMITSSRTALLEALRPKLEEFLHEVSFPGEISLELKPGWKAGVDLETVLSDSERQDLAKGYTGSGAHRSQLKVLVNNSPAATTLSRGQQKLVVYGMVMALSKLMAEHDRNPPLVLIDDLNAELDNDNILKVLNYFRTLDLQLFITALNIDQYQIGDNERVFHVKHGLRNVLAAVERQ